MKNINELVRRQQTVAFNKLKRGHDVWGVGVDESHGLKPDPKMLAMYAKDYADLMEFAHLILNNKFTEALNKGRHMDTAARDYILEDLWEFVVTYQK